LRTRSFFLAFLRPHCSPHSFLVFSFSPCGIKLLCFLLSAIVSRFSRARWTFFAQRGCQGLRFLISAFILLDPQVANPGVPWAFIDYSPLVPPRLFSGFRLGAFFFQPIHLTQLGRETARRVSLSCPLLPFGSFLCLS